MSRERDGSLEDFVEVFEWTQAHGFDAVVIGVLAVGAFSAKLDASSLSGDLDLLVSPGEQQEPREPPLQTVNGLIPAADGHYFPAKAGALAENTQVFREPPPNDFLYWLRSTSAIEPPEPAVEVSRRRTRLRRGSGFGREWARTAP